MDTGQKKAAMLVIHFPICDLCVKAIVIMNVVCTLRNVYRACCHVSLSTFDPEPCNKTKENT